MNKKIKVWAVVWTKESVSIYGVKENEIVIADISGTQIDFPLFKRKKWAKIFREGNKDWKIVKMEIPNLTYYEE